MSLARKFPSYFISAAGFNDIIKKRPHHISQRGKEPFVSNFQGIQSLVRIIVYELNSWIRRYDTQFNDIQHNGTQHKGLK